MAARVVKEDWLCQFLHPPRLVVLVKGLVQVNYWPLTQSKQIQLLLIINLCLKSPLGGQNCLHCLVLRPHTTGCPLFVGCWCYCFYYWFHVISSNQYFVTPCQMVTDSTGPEGLDWVRGTFGFPASLVERFPSFSQLWFSRKAISVFARIQREAFRAVNLIVSSWSIFFRRNSCMGQCIPENFI